jgi:Flp pilus assembly protein TadG
VCGNRPIQKIKSDCQGSTALEFALLSPVLILFLLGLFVVGWAIHCSQSVRLALEQGGRALQINERLTEQDIATLVRSKLTSIGNPEVLIALADDTSIAGVRAKKLSASYEINIAIPFYGAFMATYSTSVKVPLAVTSGA